MLFIIGVSSSYVSCASYLFIRGNGDLVTSERDVSSFDKICSGGSAEIRFHPSQESRVVVTTDSNLIDYVTTETKSKTLNIGTEWGSYSFTKIVVDVYGPVLTGVSMSGSGKFYCGEEITATSFAADVSGSGRIEGSIECDKFTARISGSGKITVSGTSRDSGITISGSGNFYGKELCTNNASVDVSGSGRAEVYVTGNLDVKISGSGRVSYQGEPRVDVKVSGSGRISRL